MRVRLTEAATAGMAQLPVVVESRMRDIFRRLEQWPAISGAKPLSGKLAGHWRVRTGDYRAEFVFDRETIIVVKVGHRDRFYEER